jgi:hypothetical protein
MIRAVRRAPAGKARPHPAGLRGELLLRIVNDAGKRTANAANFASHFHNIDAGAAKRSENARFR